MDTAEQMRKNLAKQDQEIERLRARVAELEAERAEAQAGALDLEWPLTTHLQGILGRPCFDCARYAPILRVLGQDIPQKAEAEQAAVIAWMLGHYRDDPDNWMSRIGDDIDKAKRLREEGVSNR